MQAVAKKTKKVSTKTSQKETLPRGRPTHYNPEFCKSVKEHLSEALSFASWCGCNDILPRTGYNWAKQHPDFFHAIQTGKMEGMRKCEKILMDMSTGETKGNFQALQWIMKNRYSDYWVDKIEKEVTHQVKPAIIERLDGSEIELGTQEVEPNDTMFLESGEDE